MTVDTAHALSFRRTVAGTPQTVFEAWTRPDKMQAWTCPDPTADVEVDVDLRVGGAFAIRMGVEGGPYTAQGVYREIDPPNRILYTWDWKEDAHRMGVETLVTVEFTEVDGGTEVHLRHEGFPSAEAKSGHEEGWGGCLVRLEALSA